MRYLLLLFLLIFALCKTKTSQNQLVVIFPQTFLRDAPGTDSKVLQALGKGETLTDLNVVSNFESAVSFNNETHRSPWVRVKTGDDQTGWVFGAAIRPVQKDTAWLFQKRMLCYFGAEFTSRRNGRAASGNETFSTAAELAAAYRESMALRDTIDFLLSHRAEPEEAGFQPDFSWMQGILPGFILQKMAEGAPPRLFADFRLWHEKSLLTEDKQDDAFFNSCLSAFPADSIESFFPDWKFQISETGSASRLGAGAHLKMLRSIDSALASGDLFRPELMTFKESVLNDILDKNTVYWYSKALIVKELQQILDASPACLDHRDIAALQGRSAMFEDPEANGIRVNLRSGE